MRANHPHAVARRPRPSRGRACRCHAAVRPLPPGGDRLIGRPPPLAPPASRPSLPRLAHDAGARQVVPGKGEVRHSRAGWGLTSGASYRSRNAEAATTAGARPARAPPVASGAVRSVSTVTATLSRVTSTVPSWSVLATRVECARSLATVAAFGCPYMFLAPTDITAMLGRTVASSTSEDAVALPWCAT